MSNAQEQILTNAEEVIERFGGIRPMATKTGVAVTTIQGWKKRNTIPSNRTEDILESAENNGISLSDLLKTVDVQPESAQGKSTVKPVSPAQKKSTAKSASSAKKTTSKKQAANKGKSAASGSVSLGPKGGSFEDTLVNIDGLELEESSEDTAQPSTAVTQETKTESSTDSARSVPQTSKKSSKTEASTPAFLKKTAEEDINYKLADTEKKAITKGAMISIFIFALVVFALVLLLWPKAQEMNERLDENGRKISELESQMQEEKSILGNLIPKDWQDQVKGYADQAAQLKDQATQLQQQASAALGKAKEVSNDVLGENAGTFSDRVTKLEGHMGSIAQNPEMGYFFSKIKGLQASLAGQEMLTKASTELSDLILNFDQSPEQFGAYLDGARQQSAALSQTMGDIPADDLKAAALLITMNQFRSALNRGNQNFESDLALMQNLVGDGSPELNEALARLAPKAQTGVLSLGGLTNEFRTIAGEAVVASLSGEDVNIQEKAAARMNGLLSVERNGELVTGTDTQATLARTMRLLETGKLDQAIAQAGMLDGPAADTLAPWLEEAKRTSAAQEVSSILGYNIDLQTLGAQKMQELQHGKNSGDTTAAQEFGQMNADTLQKGMSAISDSLGGLGSKGRMIEDPESGLRIYLPAKSLFAAPKGMNTP